MRIKKPLENAQILPMSPRCIYLHVVYGPTLKLQPCPIYGPRLNSSTLSHIWAQVKDLVVFTRKCRNFTITYILNETAEIHVLYMD